MAFNIEVSEIAEIDIEDVVAFIATDSPQAASRWHVDLWELIFSLRDMPKRFTIIPEAEDLEFPYLSAKHYSHRVIFRIDEAKNTVFVVRVYPGARRSLTESDLV